MNYKELTESITQQTFVHPDDSSIILLGGEGVGIDYSVHFLWHLREYIREGDELEQAIANTMKVSGKGILFNGISVIVGFSVLMYSVFLPLKAFSVLIMASIGFCLIGGMAILPAMVSLIDPEFIRK